MRVLALASLLLLLGACSAETPDPVGIGTGVHELKRSPCACILIPMTIPPGARATLPAAVDG